MHTHKKSVGTRNTKRIGRFNGRNPQRIKPVKKTKTTKWHIIQIGNFYQYLFAEYFSRKMPFVQQLQTKVLISAHACHQTQHQIQMNQIPRLLNKFVHNAPRLTHGTTKQLQHNKRTPAQLQTNATVIYANVLNPDAAPDTQNVPPTPICKSAYQSFP